MNSGNHVMLLGDLLVWFYEYLTGIQNSPTGVGFEEIVMKPYPVEGLNHVKASYKSARELVKSEWTNNNGQFLWNIAVPSGLNSILNVCQLQRTQKAQRLLLLVLHPLDKQNKNIRIVVKEYEKTFNFAPY